MRAQEFSTMTNRHEYDSSGVGELPDIDQLREYRDLMVSIVRQQGRGVRYARIAETAHTRLGTQYMLPMAVTDWSIPDRSGRTKVLRERRYSASFREETLGTMTTRLLVLESDSVRIDDIYETRRNMYRFGWNPLVGIYEAEVLPIQVVSDARTDAEIVATQSKELVTFDHEHTVNSANPDETSGYFRYVNPFRETESPWQQVSDVEFDGLLQRTDEFGYDSASQLAAE